MLIIKFSKIFLKILVIAIIAQSCNDPHPQKIKLSRDFSYNGNKHTTTLTTLRIDAKEKRNIVIFKFENDTKDPSLDWLQRGLVDLFSNELSQSPYINIVNPTRINELIKETAKNSASFKDIKLFVAKKANAQTVLSGRYYYEGDSLCIEMELRNVRNGKIFKREKVCGAGLEKLFSIVGILSGKFRGIMNNERKGNTATDSNFREITTSIDAFRCYSKAQDYSERYIWDKAAELLREAIKHDSTFALAFIKLAQMEFNNNNVLSAEKYMAKAEKYKDKLSPADRLSFNLYKIMRQQGFEAYLKALEDAVHDSPTNVDLRISLARQYLNLGFFDKALDQFELALDYDPNRKSVYNEMAYAYMFIGDYPSALRSIDKYLQLSPNEPNPFDSKGEILLQAGHFKEAKTAFKRALKIYPDFINSINRMIEINTFIGKKKEAENYIVRLNKLKKANRNNSNFSYYKFSFYWKFHDYKTLKKMIAVSMKQKPLKLSTVLSAAKFYQSIGDTIHVKKIYYKAFNYYKKRLTKSNYSKEDLDNFRKFSIVTKYKPLESFKILELQIEKLKTEQKKMEMYFTLGLLAARGGQLKRAQKYFDSSNLHDFHRLLQKVRIINWSNTWKYMFESSKYFNKGMPPEDLTADMLLDIGKNNQRRDLEVLAHMMKAQYFKQNDQIKKMENEFKLSGIPLENQWLFLGPFNADNINGFDYKYIREDNIKAPNPVQFKGKEYRWSQGDDRLCDGYIDLKSILKQSGWKTAYALIKVYAPIERRVQFRLSSIKSCKVFLNNNLVWQHYNLYDDFIDQDIITVILHRGYNTILLKLANNIGNWGFYFRISDENGKSINDIAFYSAAPENKDAMSLP